MDGVVPDYTEPIIAVRSWKTVPYNIPQVASVLPADVLELNDHFHFDQVTELRLSSPIKGNVWNPGEVFEAKCNGGPSNIHLKNVQVHQDYFHKSLEMHLEILVLPEAVMEEGFIFRFRNGQPTIESLSMPPADFPPHEGHSCGVYAMANARTAATEEQNHNVLGIVELTGRVIPAEHGWRAQYAKIVGLTSFGTDRHLDSLATLYDVPIINYGKVGPMLSDPKDFKRRKK